MYAPYPNRYQVEQIRKLAEQGLDADEISRQIQVDVEGVLVHLEQLEDIELSDPEQGSEEE
ncbi:MAG: protein of unknown function DUF2802 [Podoviridae sp. ctpVR23]|nr:MAG: protein of unknown function DUF2802 [Podoviridae sp. ctpVR23]